MKKGFTLVELLVVVVILLALGGLIFGNSSGCQSDGFSAEQRFLPDQTRARAEENQLEEMRRANELKERELDLREAELRNVE